MGIDSAAEGSALQKVQAERTVVDWLGADNQLGIDIWTKKYCWQNESFEDWLKRVSGGSRELEDLIWEKKFLFGGRTLSNRGTTRKATLSNCYSLGYVGDSLTELMQAATDIADTFKAQGGQGISLSKVRPKDTDIGTNGFKSDGIIPFMEIFNQVTASISQGGSRKGALIMTLDAWHKEAGEFITVKSETDRITKANLSLEIDDDFMACVKKYYETGEEVTKTITRTYQNHTVTYEVTPIRLYRLMISKAWDWGEPGCIFTEKFRNYNIMEFCDDYQIETCNPCGEQPLPRGGCCNLGSINLSMFVKDPFTESARFDFDEFVRATAICVREMDRIVTENTDNHALPLQREMAENYRNIGIGIMGLYDALAKLGLAYDSKEGMQLTDQIMNVMFRASVKASSCLAAKLGCFPRYTEKVWESTIIREHFSQEEIKSMKKDGLRNCSLLSIAPAGSIGTMLNCSTGAEPAFSISYKRRTESLNGGEDKEYEVFTGVASDYKKLYPDNPIPPYLKTSGEIAWRDRVDMQGILQKHVDTGISSTVNLKQEVTVEEIEQLYLYAWEKGCKGITIFRDGCKRLGILTKDTPKKEPELEEETADLYDQDNSSATVSHASELPRGFILAPDDSCIGLKRTITSGCGTLHVEAFFDPENGDLYETYFSKGSTGGCNSFMSGLSRMVSLAARGGVPLGAILDQLHSALTCPSYSARNALKHDTSRGNSCPSAIAYALEVMHRQVLDLLGLPGEEELERHGSADAFSRPVIPLTRAQVQAQLNTGAKLTPARLPGLVRVSSQKDDGEVDLSHLKHCPECNNTILYYEAGCVSCPSCGWTKCE